MGTMQLSSDPLLLDHQLTWLLAGEPRVALGNRLQPRAACLPLAQQHALILSATALLLQHTTAGAAEQISHASPDRNSTHSSSLQQATVHPKLVRLLQLMSDSRFVGSNSFTQQTASMALQHVQQAPYHHHSRQVYGPLHPGVLFWVPSSTLKG